MTTLDYLDNNYLDSAQSTIIDIDRAAGAILLDHTPLHPQGGHQASDQACLRYGNLDIQISEARNKVGLVWHVVSEPALLSQLQPGLKVSLQLNWPRRYQLMRLHTAQHLISSLATRDHGLKTLDLAIEPEGCSLKFDRTPSLDELMALQTAAHAAIIENLPVTRTQENGRYAVAIGTLDQRECGCTHVRSLSEIGELRIDNAAGPKIHFNVAENADRLSDRWQQDQLYLQQQYPPGISDAVSYATAFERQHAEVATLRKERGQLSEALLRLQLPHNPGGARIRVFDRPEISIANAREVAQGYLSGRKQLLIIRCQNGTLLALSSIKSKPAANVMDILKTLDPNFKGGGNAGFAQGGPWLTRLDELPNIIAIAFLEVCAFCD